MKIFMLAVVAAIGLAVCANIVLAGHEQESAQAAFASSTARP